ncbi:unnamed protein product [Plutella xylostella]|uniref:(diamondback moth) hypothetical protein n=1 Tax=Plutella xylostella TaxID=51655 RepID=A0A8S4FY61_PLUXY|nr:unnamed protein product [Plutella xylostella]
MHMKLSITMGVNAFRGFMDEFMSQHDTEKARTKRKKDKKRKSVNKGTSSSECAVGNKATALVFWWPQVSCLSFGKISSPLRIVLCTVSRNAMYVTMFITMGVNAFRGFMDEFMSQHDTDKAWTKRKKEKKRKVDDPIQYKGHNFILSMINIPTECEICKTFFMWPIEKSLICQSCKLASHKKCYTKVTTHCRKFAATPSASIVGALDAGGRQQFGVLKRGKIFGVPLSELPTGESNIPLVVDRLITTIEMTGLYTEGLYRKSGLSSKRSETYSHPAKYRLIHRLIGRKCIEAKENWINDRCTEVESLQARHDSFNMYKKINEILGLKKKPANNTLIDKNGAYAMTIKEKLDIWNTLRGYFMTTEVKTSNQ